MINQSVENYLMVFGEGADEGGEVSNFCAASLQLFLIGVPSTDLVSVGLSSSVCSISVKGFGPVPGIV